MKELIQKQLAGSIATMQATMDDLNIAETLATISELTANAMSSGRKLMIAGNGGSASDAQHIAAEFVVRFIDNRPAMPAIALTTDTSILTAGGNDFGFEQVFARQVEALGREGDLAIGITTSGKSPNVTRALKAAKAGGMVAAALCGKDGGELVGVADPLLIVPSNTTARIQEMHVLAIHLISERIDAWALASASVDEP